MSQGAGVDRGLRLIASGFAVIGGLALFALAAITVVSVFWRYVLRDPIFGIEDLSTMSLVVVVAASVAYGALQGAHVSVNIIKLVATRRLTRVTDALARIFGIAICAFATYGLFTKGACGLPCGAMTSNLAIIHTPFYYVLGAAMGFLTLVLLWHLIVGVQTWAGDDPNEARD